MHVAVWCFGRLLRQPDVARAGAEDDLGGVGGVAGESDKRGAARKRMYHRVCWAAWWCLLYAVTRTLSKTSRAGLLGRRRVGLCDVEAHQVPSPESTADNAFRRQEDRYFLHTVRELDCPWRNCWDGSTSRLASSCSPGSRATRDLSFGSVER